MDHHTRVFGYTEPNIEFLEGLIERLDVAGLEDEAFDLIV